MGPGESEAAPGGPQEAVQVALGEGGGVSGESDSEKGGDMMTKWEYKAEWYDFEEGWQDPESGERITDVTKTLNVFGAEGWELVNFVPVMLVIERKSSVGAKSIAMIFKRPASPEV